MMRTYAGHSTAKKSNELYRANLAKGQTGLSVAFDLPTQTGYDADHELARGEVGKVGVPIAHNGDMHTLLDGIPLDEMNTSMTINATAAWLLGALHRHRRGATASTQASPPGHDAERHHQGVPRPRDLRVPARAVDAADRRHGRLHGRPRSRSGTRSTSARYHLQEAGATPVQEIAYAMSNAIAVLDAVRERVDEELMGQVFGRISFFVNAGVRFVEEHAKLRAMGELWEEIGRERYGVDRRQAAALPLRRAGQLARPDRVAAGEQRPAHRARGARRHARPQRARPRDPAARRGTRRSACRARGTSSGRCASSRCSPSRPTCSSTPTSSRARRSWTGLVAELRRGRPRRDGRRRRARRRGRGGRRT